MELNPDLRFLDNTYYVEIQYLPDKCTKIAEMRPTLPHCCVGLNRCNAELHSTTKASMVLS